MSDMDAVNSFNAELQSLYDVKPPISKGKMTSITRAALKAVKLYKHAVQSVEKFIQKCKAEYKIPGLYVIDSIIRQSRHQFGAEKDVFAPRFARNIQNTFVHLYRCPEEDKAKIIRVLNLWQKNRIFSPEVIQPLFDLADPQNPIWEQIQNSNIELGGNNINNSSGGGGAAGANSNNQGFQSVVNNLPPVHFNKKLLDFDYGEDDDGGGGNASKNSADVTNSAASNPGLDALGSILSNPEILRQLQTLQEQMAAAAAVAAQQQMGPSYANTPEQERQRKLAELSKQEAAFDQRLAETVARLPFAKDCELPLPDDSKGTPKRGDGVGSSSTGHFSRDHVDQNSNQLSNHNPNVLLPPPFFQQLTEQSQQQSQQHQNSQQQQQQQQQQQLLNLFRNVGNSGGPSQNPFGLPMPFPIQGVPPPFPPPDVPQNMGLYNPPTAGMESLNSYSGFAPPPGHHHLNNNQTQNAIQISQKIYEEIDLCDDSKEAEQQRVINDRGRSKRSRSHDRHKSGRSPSSRTRRSRSRSRSRGRKRYRSRSRERREEREKEKERQRKGLPTIKKEHLSVCSTTLWVGHLSKLVSQEEISDTFGAYGDIISIDLISPRGCAFIVMNRRQDAVRALDRLKNTKLQGKTITLAWAPGKGVKGKEWKDYWEVGDGVSYIPWIKLRDDTNTEEFEDGGCIDEDALPDFLKNKPQPPDNKPMDPNAPPLPDNENSEDSIAMPNPPLPPTASVVSQIHGLLGTPGAGGMSSLLDPITLAAAAAASAKGSDTDARNDSGLPPPNSVAPPLPPGPFGMGPPVGMMPMGMNLMVPPPMLAMPGFQGMAGLPGMSMLGMGMVPPALPVPPSGGPLHPIGAPGLLGEIPNMGTAPPSLAAVLQPQQQLNDNLNLNSSLNNEESSSSDLMMEEVKCERPRGKKRSRFDDPDEKISPSVDNSMDMSNSPSQDRLKDDRPVFERLKSLAEGYSFATDKSASSLLGTPPIGPRGPLDHHLPNSHGFNQPALLPRPGAPPPLFGTADNRPHQPWFDTTENPFLNPNPSNPFVGNPFIQGNMSENPFEIANSRSDANPFATNDRGSFGGGHRGGRGGWSRDTQDSWAGSRGGRGGRGGRGTWRGGRGGWNGGNNLEHLDEMDRENDQESRGDRGFRGRGGRGGGRDSQWSRSGTDQDRRDSRGGDRPRSREEDRERGRSRRSKSPGSHHRESSGSRRRRTSPDAEDSRGRSNSRSHRPRSRHRSGENSSDNRNRRDSENRSSHWQSKHDHEDHLQPQQMDIEEDWETEGNTAKPSDGDVDWENNGGEGVENCNAGDMDMDGDEQNNPHLPSPQQEQEDDSHCGNEADEDNQQVNEQQWNSQQGGDEDTPQQDDQYDEYNDNGQQEGDYSRESEYGQNDYESKDRTDIEYENDQNAEYDDEGEGGGDVYNNDRGGFGDSFNEQDHTVTQSEERNDYSSYNNDYNDENDVNCEQIGAHVGSSGDNDNGNGEEDDHQCTTSEQLSSSFDDSSKCIADFPSEELNSISSPLS